LQSTALRYFLEVVRTGSIAEASTRLNVAGSAISRQIARLERDLGVALFERRPRGMVASSAGELLARHARRTFLDLEHVILDVRRLQGLKTGVVKIASTEGFALDLLPEAILDFRKHYPGISFNLEVLSPVAVTRKIRDGDVDLGLSFALAPAPGVRVEMEGRAPIHALMAPNYPLTSKEVITLAELREHPLALPAADTTARQLFDIACGLESIAIEPALVSNSMAALRAFAEAGGGITIAGRVTVLSRLQRSRLAVRPITGSALDQRLFQIQTMLGRNLPDAVSAFLEHLRSFVSGRT
jgi:DNA-binding transcriptional LysR family regulator